MDWYKFKEAVKICRERSGVVNGFDTWVSIRVNTQDHKSFDLNPFRINLQSGNYGTEYDLRTGKLEVVSNLKEIVENM